jgi:hypothetical protein
LPLHLQGELLAVGDLGLRSVGALADELGDVRSRHEEAIPGSGQDRSPQRRVGLDLGKGGSEPIQDTLAEGVGWGMVDGQPGNLAAPLEPDQI